MSCTIQEKQVEIIPSNNFKTTIEGQDVGLYTLTNDTGAVAQLTNYGARIVALWMPDRDGGTGLRRVLWFQYGSLTRPVGSDHL